MSEPVLMTQYQARAACADWGLEYCWQAVRDRMVACGGWRMIADNEAKL